MKKTILTITVLSGLVAIILNSVLIAEEKQQVTSVENQSKIDTLLKEDKNTPYKKAQVLYEEKGSNYNIFQERAQKGDMIAQYFLAKILFEMPRSKGEDIKNRQKRIFNAISLYKKSAEQGEPHAQYELGRLHSLGLVVKYNMPLSIEYYDLACQQEHKSACFNLGNIYREGRGGTKKDYLKALSLYQIPAKQKHAKALANIGMIYDLGGYGVSKDRHKAFQYYSKASKAGSSIASYNLQTLCQVEPNVCKGSIKNSVFNSIK